MNKQTSRDGKATAFVYYLFAFVLLWEWLRPLQNFTDTANTLIFVFFIGVSFLLIFFKAPWYVTIPVKIILILFMLHGLFYDGVFFGFLWVNELVLDITSNISLIQQANWTSMTSPFRSLLFFILLWLLVYLIHYWILFHKRIFLFFVLTLLYITVLDTFTPYDATLAIVRTVLIGFFMIGLLYFDRLKKVEKLNLKRYASIRWILPLFAFIAVSILLAFFAPKASPQWPDPVPYLTAIGREDGEGGLKKIGYSANDDQLGGGFIEDNTEVFTHISAERHYWRIETKDVYTGKGWEVSDPDAGLDPITNVAEELIWIDERVVTKNMESTVTINKEYRHLHFMYPLGLTSIETDNKLGLYLNRNSELITPFQENEGSREEFMTYKVNYKLPSYPLKEMRRDPSSTVPEGFLDRYTQLPDSLPSRVRELATHITATEANQFDKAKAIESYLGSVEFSYDKKDVAIPSEDQDYVDQFLFETLKGYCDNFSTSMIVLLRSVDIPARWVKGYTEGEFVESVNNTEKKYQVTNNNAHSWVEVYFEGVGWVPFEPTKGFVNPYNLTSDYTATDEQAEANEQDEVFEEDEQEQTPEKPEQEEEKEEETVAETEEKVGSIWNNQDGLRVFYIVILIMIVIGFAVYKLRRKWLPILIIHQYRKRHDDTVFFQAYESLLKQFERYGIKRKESQSLRDYAQDIDLHFQIEDMTILTKRYERALYRRNNAAEEWDGSSELWENLIKRTSS